MEIRHIMHTARSATIEIADGGRYFTKQPVELRVNGEPSLTTEKTITSLFSLKPDQKCGGSLCERRKAGRSIFQDGL